MPEPASDESQRTVEVQAPSAAPPAPPSLDKLLGQASGMGRSSFLTLLRADQRKRWERGEPMMVENYLALLPDLRKDEEGLLDLIYSEVVLRGQLGDAPCQEEYLRRFPDYEMQLRRQFALNDALDADSLLNFDGGSKEASAPEEAVKTLIYDALAPVTPLTKDGSDGDSIKVPAPRTVTDARGAPAPEMPSRGEWPAVKGYVLLAELGRGGMGVVYKARQIALKRTVALKMILSGAHASGQELDRLRGEAEAVARLQHPGIVQIYEVGEQSGLPYLALEFVEGGSLDRKLKGTPLSPNEAAGLVQSLAEAMYYAHQQGIIHRDLKPANILLQGEKERGSSASLATSLLGSLSPKITDFGLAKQLESASHLTGSGAIVGTPSYMAPEQAAAKNDTVGPCTDVYALGAILYECLTGRPPFRAATPVDTILQVLSEEPVAPMSLNPKVPRDLQTICLKCLEKSPLRRYTSAAALADDLRRWLNGEPITARPVSWLERTVKWVRRRPVVSALLLLLVVTVLGFSSGMTVLWLRAAAARDAESVALANEIKEKEKAEERLYFNRISLADREWSSNNVSGVEELLDHYKDERRGWEWHYLKRLCHAELLSLPGMECVAFSPDGKWLAAASQDRDVRLWDAHTGKPGATLKGHTQRVTRLAFSPDGKWLASAGEDKIARLWDVARAAVVHELKIPDEPVVWVAFSPDGKLLAAANNNDSVKVWDVASGKELYSLSAHTTVAFSPDGKLLAAAVGAAEEGDDSGKDVVQLWDAATGKEVRTFEGPRGHAAAINSIAFSPSGDMLVTASDDQTVKLWDVATGKEVRTIYAHSGRVARVVFSRDGRTLAGVTGDVQVPGAAKVWDAATGQELRAYRWATKGGKDLAFHPDGRRLATADAESVKVWDAANDPESHALRGHTNKVSSVVFSPDGTRLASGDEDGTVRVWDALTGKQVAQCLGHLKPVFRVAFSPDGKTLASASSDNTVLFWDPTTGDEVRSLRHPGPVLSLAFSPDGRWLATSHVSEGNPGAVKLWDVATGKEMRSLPARQVTSLAFSPDGRRLVGQSEFVVTVWDPASGEEAFRLDKGGVSFSSVAFSPDSKYLLTTRGSADRGDVVIWDAQTGAEVMSVPGRGGRVTGMAFSPDGRRLALSCWDHTVKLWAPRTGQDILTLRGHTGRVTSVAFSPDGDRIASASEDRTVRIWDATPLP